MTEVARQTGSGNTAIRPFQVSFPDVELTELRRRVNATRWPERETVADASPIGIAVHDGAHADFARMYRDADAALYKGREDGKSRIGVFTPPDAEPGLTDRELSKQSQRYVLPFGSH